MTPTMRRFISCGLLAALLGAPAPAAADEAAFVDALQSMMAELRPESRRAAQDIKVSFGPMVVQAFANRSALELAIERQHVALLAEDALAFNIDPRLNGRHPIGEKDLANQQAYVAARPAALGLLYAIASRVETSPIEVTSLVRHMQYQRALAGTNGNANTDVPTHAMGLAFDIALINTPLATAYEIRDVLLEMREAGALYFIGESRQLVFHVVPRRAWFGYFEALQWAMTNVAFAPPAPPTLDDLMPRPIPPPPVIERAWWERVF